MTRIEWTDETWNPVVGCSRVSEGCRHCYAETMASRLQSMRLPEYEGIAKRVGGEARWTGVVRCLPERLEEPLKWRKPRLVFVNSMSDLFHEEVPFGFIAAVFGVMAACPQHTFQILTKRPERAENWVDSMSLPDLAMIRETLRLMGGEAPEPKAISNAKWQWPLPNVWIGVSVEDQITADERIPRLLQLPAAIRFVSYEPALGLVDPWPWLMGAVVPNPGLCASCDQSHGFDRDPSYGGVSKTCSAGSGGGYSRQCDHFARRAPSGGLDWMIVGGESGANARPFDISWARSVVGQCKAAGVPVFVKQLGSRPYDLGGDHPCPDGKPPVGCYLDLLDRKGGDLSEWPEDLRVRELPPLAAEVAP